MPPLPGLTAEGNRVVWMCGATPELNITSAPTTMKLALMIGDLRLELEQVIKTPTQNSYLEEAFHFNKFVTRKYNFYGLSQSYPLL